MSLFTPHADPKTDARLGLGAGETRPNWRLFWLLVAGMVVLLAIGYLERLFAIAQVQNEVAAMQADIRHMEQWKLELEAEFAYVQSDEYVAARSRSELGLSLPGDRVFANLAIPTATPEIVEEPAAVAPNLIPFNPFDPQWWSLFLR